MARFSQLPPQDEAALLEQVALAAITKWPIECQHLAPLKVRENAVYEVVTTTNRRVALRVHRYGYHSNRSLESEFIWTRALNDFGLEAPVPLRSRSGHLFEIIEVPGIDGPRQVDLFEWIDGHPMGSSERSRGPEGSWIERAYGGLGELAARLHNHSSTWRIPVDFERHVWDAAGLVGEQPLWGRFWELGALNPRQRAFFAELRDRLYTDLIAYGTTPDRYGLIHADLVPDNVLEHEGQLRMIDFDDAGFGWHMFELATSLYFLRPTPVYGKARDALIAGYRRRRLLDEGHVKRLPLFLAVRGTTYLGWLHSRQGEAAIQGRVGELIDRAASVGAEYLDS